MDPEEYLYAALKRMEVAMFRKDIALYSPVDHNAYGIAACRAILATREINEARLNARNVLEAYETMKRKENNDAGIKRCAEVLFRNRGPVQIPQMGTLE